MEKDIKMNKIMLIKNSYITPDGTVLISEHTHDYKSHKDKITDKIYAIDGGNDYSRTIGDIEDCIDNRIFVKEGESFTKEKFELIRNNFKWGTYGKNGKSPLKLKNLNELSNEHIDNILKTQTHLKHLVRGLFLIEKEYRIKNYIFLED